MDSTPMPSSSAIALRNAFGDRKPLDISRKITACVACRKLKLKCSMPDTGPPCERCSQRRLSCVVNRSLQQVLESDLSWKDSIEERLALLEGALFKTSNHQHPYREWLLQQSLRNAEIGAETDEDHPTEETTFVDEQQGWEVNVGNDSAPAAVPASYIAEVSGPTSLKRKRGNSSTSSDMVSIGVLPISNATSLFDNYRTRLDHFLYGVLDDHHDLSATRRASSLLADAIYTVSALHTRFENYAAYRGAFMKQVSKHLFLKRCTPDDVRGLCIGAFWLSDLSWTLVGLAVRMANEINLNRAFVQPQYESRQWYLNARLYLLVHVCDRHLSIVYGRAPMSETFQDFSFVNDFLNSKHAGEDDKRLVSQLEIWSINYRTYKAFGLDTEGVLPETHMADLRRINISLETWRADWEEKLQRNRYVGNYPQQGVGLHHEFAKLYLCSHAYRGLFTAQADESISKGGLIEFASNAVFAAESILQAINDDTEIQSHLNGLPTYFDTMIAFAVVFLLKVITKPRRELRVDVAGIMKLLQCTTNTLEKVSLDMRPEHILCSISRSVKKLIEKASNALNADPQRVQGLPAPADITNADGELTFLVSPDDSIFLGNFDFTVPPQDTEFNFMDFITLD